MEATSEVGDGFSESETGNQHVEGDNVTAFDATGVAEEPAAADVHRHRRILLRPIFVRWADGTNPITAASSDAYPGTDEIRKRRRQGAAI